MFDSTPNPQSQPGQPSATPPPEDTGGAQLEQVNYGTSAVEAGRLKPVDQHSVKDTGVPGDDISFYEMKAPLTQSKIFLVLLGIVAFLIVAGGVWWAYSAFTNRSPDQENKTAQPSAATEPSATDAGTLDYSDIPDNEEPAPAASTPTTLPLVTNTSTPAPVSEPTQPAVADSDNDGLTDQQENGYGTDPNNADSDSDGIRDKEELEVWNTDPLNADSDGDTFSDGTEIKAGYNPRGAGKLLTNPGATTPPPQE